MLDRGGAALYKVVFLKTHHSVFRLGDARPTPAVVQPMPNQTSWRQLLSVRSLIAAVAAFTVRLVAGTALTRAAAREAEMRTIIDSTAEGIIVIEEQGAVRLFNAAAERMFGYQAKEVVGRNVSMLMASPYRERHDGYLASYARTGEAHVLGREREVEGLRRAELLEVLVVPARQQRLREDLHRDPRRERDVEARGD